MAERNLVLQLLITAKDQASGIVSGFVSSAKTQFAALTASIGAAFSFREAAIFEKALDAIRARADETGPALDTLIQRARDAAQTLGPQFGFSATAAAGGIKELIAAGFSANEAISALNGTLALAAMEEISVAKAATLISDAIAQFGLKAEDASRVADILAKSAGAVAATAVEMAEALKYTGNEASRSGMSLTETSAVLDVLAKAGQRGSEAGTGLASVLSILNNPAHAATKSLFDLGATSTELSSVLDFLQQRGLNASQTIALFGEQGARVINTLLAQGGSKAIADFADQIGKAGKSAEETAKIMQGNFLGALDRFWESLKRVGVELATPKLEPFAKGLDTLTDALNTFASNSRIQSFQKAIADGFSAAYEKARAFTGRIDWSGISTAIGNAFSTIGSAVGKAGEALGSIYSSLTGTLPGAASIAQQASDGLKAAWGGLGALAEGVASGIERIAQALGGSVAPSAQQTQTAMDGVTESAQKQATGFQALWQALKTDALQGLKATWDSLTRGAGDLLSAVNSLAQKGSEVLAGFIRNADFGPLRDLFNAVADSVKRLTGTMTEGFPNAQSAAATFANSFTIAWSGVTGILSAVISGTIKVVEAIGRATFEVGKYFDRYSDEEIQRIEANLNGLSTSAGEFAGVAARSFEASGKALDRMKGNAAAAEQQQQRLTQAAASGVTAQDALAGATAKQASSQQAAQEKVMLLAEGIKRQQAEVTRLAEADQSSVAAKNAHAAATQKLWGMQEDYTSALIAANSAATGSAQSQEQLDTALVNAGLALAQYVPSLDDLRQKMEQTRQQYEAVRKAQENKTLADTAEKSAT
ncbi:MAG TPA: phage tail tape measure protein, partial [Candidatus Competibacter sp.]|nr:phage tail tape measure protein [Candidatus Competibacter sp.]